jgi:hypothetical protein
MRSMFICFLTFALTPCAAFVSAQTNGGPAETETNRGPIIPFLEATEVFWTLRGGGSWFPNRLEGDIFPHLVVYQNFSDVLNLDQQRQRGVARFRERSISISGTPAVRLRMLRETSAPVRTPSFMPKGNVQFFWVRGLKDAATDQQRSVAAASAADRVAQAADVLGSIRRVSLWEGHFIIGHHSNGQDGCLSLDQQRDPDTEECLPVDARLDAGTINRQDGSFSTNYMKFGVNYSRNWLNAGATAPATRELRFRAEWEVHPKAWMDEDMVDLYGRQRLNLGVAYALRNLPGCRRRAEGSGSVSWNPGVDPSVTELSNILQVSCFPWLNGGWGFFVRLYSGQDYYNVGFLDEITRVHVGMTFNQTDFFRFRRSPDRQP